MTVLSIVSKKGEISKNMNASKQKLSLYLFLDSVIARINSGKIHSDMEKVKIFWLLKISHS